jgi:hypothetical protein
MIPEIDGVLSVVDTGMPHLQFTLGFLSQKLIFHEEVPCV